MLEGICLFCLFYTFPYSNQLDTCEAWNKYLWDEQMHYTCSDEEVELWNQASWIAVSVQLFINYMTWDKVLILLQGGC